MPSPPGPGRALHAAQTSLVRPARLVAYRALLAARCLPQVRQAIRNDARTAETSDVRLKTVAAKIARIYRDPQHYRRTSPPPRVAPEKSAEAPPAE